jgi:hypothetical protein
MHEKPWQFIGVVDSYGAVLSQPLYGFNNEPTHEELWPYAQKRWRFVISDWSINKSILSKENLTDEDCEAVLSHMEKKAAHLKPRWARQGDAWDAAGRPRGKKYEKWLADWEEKNPIKSVDE